MKEILILVGGALLGYVGKYLEELYRRTAIRTELLRKAYTSWFSTEVADAVKSVVGSSEDLLGLNRDIHASVLRVREQAASRLAK